MQNKNQVVIYGRHAVFAALANPRRSIVRVVCLKENAAELRGRIGEKKLSVVERRELEKMLPREAVLAALLERLDAVRASYLAGRGFVPWRDEWNALDAYAGQEVAVRDGERELVGIDAGVDDTGRLLLDTASGRIACCVGDVSLRPLA